MTREVEALNSDQCISGQPRPVFAERHGTSDRLTIPAGTLHLEGNSNAHRKSTQVQQF